ncbi:MAG TPA: DUF1214 domain-containing protein [Candidatus Limnocylindria bacterium]|nr:DUF1214 domain-containing protein [Candidatus Limnocylindria bacterium]
MINLALFAVLAVGGGLASAWYMIEAGSRLSTRTSGPWITWSAAGRPDADPYTRAHTVRNGLLPLASTLEITYQAKADTRGGRLHAGCEYAIVMEGLDGGGWWSLAAFDGQGGLIPNPADRYAFSSASVMREPDGRAIITLARDARPGNWLPIGGSRVNLVLTVQDAAWAAAVYDGREKALPPIQRLACR